MKVLLTGASGQLGQALIKSTPRDIQIITPSRQQLDLRKWQSCYNAITTHLPDWVLNAGAYTAVDKAENEHEIVDSINAKAPAAFASALKLYGGSMLQVSTDYVFNGQQGFPYLVDQECKPLNLYGKSKAAGEDVVQRVLGISGRGLILRTSWLIGPVGNNFVHKMLCLHKGREKISVVADQVRCPTSTINLATACWQIISLSRQGIELPPVMHWSDAGVASWYDLAIAVGRLGHELGLIDQPADVKPISTADYPSVAKRPSYSLLDCRSTYEALKLPIQHWEQALRIILQHINKD